MRHYTNRNKRKMVHRCTNRSRKGEGCRKRKDISLSSSTLWTTLVHLAPLCHHKFFLFLFSILQKTSSLLERSSSPSCLCTDCLFSWVLWLQCGGVMKKYEKRDILSDTRIDSSHRKSSKLLLLLDTSSECKIDFLLSKQTT